MRRGRLYFVTGDDPTSGLLGLADGGIERFNLKTMVRSPWAFELTMPNGLAFLPNRDAVVSRDLGQGTGIIRVPHDDPSHPQANWAEVAESNGMAVDSTDRWLCTVQTFAARGRVYRVRINHPSRIDVVAAVGDKALDDMTIDRDDRLYIAAGKTGEIVRVNPDVLALSACSRAACRTLRR